MLIVVIYHYYWNKCQTRQYKITRQNIPECVLFLAPTQPQSPYIAVSYDGFPILDHCFADQKDDSDVEREGTELAVRAIMLARSVSRCTVAVKITRGECSLDHTPLTPLAGCLQHSLSCAPNITIPAGRCWGCQGSAVHPPLLHYISKSQKTRSKMIKWLFRHGDMPDMSVIPSFKIYFRCYFYYYYLHYY